MSLCVISQRIDELTRPLFFLERRMAPTKPKKGEKAKEKTQEHKETKEAADSLREAISALGGDDEDYALLKAVDDDREMVTSGSHADVCF